MSATFRPCPYCGRHVRTSDSACPFCASALPAAFAAFEYTLPSRRMSRAALAAFGATLALSTGCASTSMGQGDGGDAAADAQTQADSAMQDTMQQPDISIAAYGQPPPEDAGVAPPYGIPPRDE
ncbi:MAG: hypothetical protein Q8Q09_10590 [Deltaproteobacteria bacterium]|nr:hypothetical protein [Deltaproteobacteria bacterium]